jgi:hypothetical protein
MSYRLLADAVVILHICFVLFVVCGGLLVRRRRWIAWAHIPAAVWGVFIEYSGWICPLTPLENAFRERAGEGAYSGDFIGHYALPLLYPENLTRTAQAVLGSAALALNGFVYWQILRTRARSRM